ncbi:MAG: TonB-dependent receptor [Desulfobacteraceae bacterium]|jgi:iron complex outermembrane receptor protein
MKKIVYALVFLYLVFVFPPAFSEEIKINLPETEIESTFEEQDFVGPLFTETNTSIKVTEKGITAQGPSATMSPHKAISLMPSVNQQSIDPSGLADISNYHESFRFRGVEPTGGGNPGTPVNVENVPVSGRPGGGVTIYDMENFKSVSIYKGGVPADQAFGLTNIGGKIDMEIKDPKDVFGVDLKQDFGSDSYSRTFLRLDTGLLGSGTGVFLSFSGAGGDKWKGEGDSSRTNAMLGLSQSFNDKLKVSAYTIYNNADVNTYRTLNYTQVSSLSDFYDFDYTTDSTDYYYYGYNKSDFEDLSVMLDLEYSFSDKSRLSVTPYYWQDKGDYLETLNANRIRNWVIDHDMSGVLTRYSLDLENTSLDMGYFYLKQERPGPPTAMKLFQVTDTGLQFNNWQILSEPTKHIQNQPFVSGKYTMGNLTLEGGVKYLDYTMPEIITYFTTGIGDVSYKDALAMADTVEENASADEKDFTELLPNLGASYILSDTLSSYFSYGRNYGLSVKLYPYFISQKQGFYQAGITLQDLWDTQELEIVDNFDLGLRYITEKLYVVPTVYYATHKNKLAVYYDGTLDIYYPATNAEAESYGFELEAGAVPMEKMSVYGSFSYNRFYFSQDLRNRTGGIVPVDGKQVPDAPKLMFKGILSYEIGDFTLSTIMKYTGSRYGDVLHNEKIDSSTIFNLEVNYSKEIHTLGMKKLDLSLTLNNIFNKEYISIINTSDYQTLGSTYMAGAPFTAYVSFSISI